MDTNQNLCRGQTSVLREVTGILVRGVPRCASQASISDFRLQTTMLSKQQDPACLPATHRKFHCSLFLCLCVVLLLSSPINPSSCSSFLPSSSLMLHSPLHLSYTNPTLSQSRHCPHDLQPSSSCAIVVESSYLPLLDSLIHGLRIYFPQILFLSLHFNSGAFSSSIPFPEYHHHLAASAA